MTGAPLALAFAAGLVATVNPCGFAMLPAYLAYFLGIGDRDDAEGVDASLGRALAVGGVASLGFLTVFGAAGLLVHAGLRVVIDLIPWFALGVGIAVVALGVAMLAGFQPSLSVAARATRGSGVRSTFGFGVAYALASLSCTLPVFLTVVVGSLATTSIVGGVATFLAYGLAMSLVLVGITIAVALARDGVLRRLRTAGRHVHRVAAVLLVAAGSYVTLFWATALRDGPVAQGDTARFVEGWSARAVDFASANWQVIGVVLLALVTAAILRLLLRTSPRREPDRHDASVPPRPTPSRSLEL